MATAGTVTIRLDGDSATLIRELNKANQASKSTFGEIKAAAADVATKFAAVGAAATVALAALAARSFETIDALAKTADRLDLSTESLRTFQVAADLAGVNQELLTKSLQRQQKTLVDASNGMATAQRAFSQLGLSAQQLINMPMEQQFQTIAEALAGVDNITRRNALAMEIWGSRAAEMLNLVKEGVGDLGELKKLLNDLNVNVSRFDASKIEQANDAVSLAKLAFEGLGNSIAVAVAPLVQGLAEDFTEAARQTGGFRAEVQTTMDRLVDGSVYVVNSIQGIGRAFMTVGKAIQAVSYGVVGLVVEAFSSLADIFRAVVVNPILLGLQKIVEGAAAVAGAFNLDGLAAGAGRAAAAIEGVRAALEDATASGLETGANMIGFGLERGGEIVDDWLRAFETEWAGSAWQRRYRGYVQASEEAAAKARQAFDGGGTDSIAAQEAAAARAAELQKRINDGLDANAKSIKPTKVQVDVPATVGLDPELIRGFTEIQTQQYLEAWMLANEQRVAAEEEVRRTLFQGDQQAGAALIELAAAQARERVRAEFEARGEAFDEAGVPLDPKAREQYELEVQEQTLANEASFLDRRLALQQAFGSKFTSIQQALTKLFGESWAAANQKTLNSMAAFASTAHSIAQTFFGNNKKFAIAQATIATLVGAAEALRLGWPLGPIAAAQVLATGFAQVTAIKGTSPGGGGSVGSIGGAGGVGGGYSTPVASDPLTGRDASAGQKAAQIVVHGPFYGWDQYIEEKVIGALHDAVRDRDVILISPGSRNALDLVPD